MNGNTKVRQAGFRLIFYTDEHRCYANMILLARLSIAVVSITGILCFSGCESTGIGSASVNKGKPGGTSSLGNEGRDQAVPSADVKKLQAWQDANMIAGRSQGREALVGGGRSMNPVYGENTMLVVHPIAFEKLTVGMTVVYVNRDGKRVAHQLVAKEANGWRARGLNNLQEDTELITRDNLVGVVYASLVHADP